LAGPDCDGKRWIGGESPPTDGRWNIVIGVVSDDSQKFNREVTNMLWAI
jgi:hypothetical protein